MSHFPRSEPKRQPRGRRASSIAASPDERSAGPPDRLGETAEFQPVDLEDPGYPAPEAEGPESVAGEDEARWRSAGEAEGPGGAAEEADDPWRAADEADGEGSPARATIANAADRVTRWFAGLDRRPEFDPDPDLGPIGDPSGRPARTAESHPEPERTREAEGPSRFPLSPLGYNRQVVDDQLAELERQLAELRENVDPPISINEEIERIGEQTASILVVAHDQAHETTRRAQEQAEQCIADAASNAVAITAEAKQRLRELDEETDAVWRERERLLDDVRTVSASLATLAEEASERFPADGKQSASLPTRP